jgi:sugar phosphate isomerase/epimerase
MTHLTRRNFLSTSLASGAALAAGTRANAIEPIRRTGKSHLKLSIAAYSFRKYLDLKIKPKPPMTLDDFADLAVGMELDAIEPTGYYFADASPKEMARYRGRCTRLGLDISSTAIANNFCVRDPEKLRTEIAHVKKWTELASMMGAKTVRIFAGNMDRGDTDEAAMRDRVVSSIQECCDHAGKFGIYLALENHGGVTAACDQILAIVKAVQNDWFGVNLDTANFRTDDPYADLQRLAPYAVVVQTKTEIQPKGKPLQLADLPRLMQILRDAGYRGYVALEYEAAAEPKTAVPVAIAELKKLMG